jgi:hypothetical protein
MREGRCHSNNERGRQVSTRKRIRRGTFRSVAELLRAIEDYIGTYNQNPRPFQWVASAGKIIRKVRKYKAISDA